MNSLAVIAFTTDSIYIGCDEHNPGGVQTIESLEYYYGIWWNPLFLSAITVFSMHITLSFSVQKNLLRLSINVLHE